MSHTPGPWRAVFYVDGGFAIDAGNDTEVLIIASRGPWPSRIAESHHNAHLMAAAPDLLEALLDVQNQFLNPEERHIGWRQRMAETVAAAIAKAVPS